MTARRKGWKWSRRTDWESPVPAASRWHPRAQRFQYVAYLGRCRGWAWRWHGQGWEADGYANATAAMKAAERARLPRI